MNVNMEPQVHMNVNIPPHPPTPRVRSINCCRKFTWTLTSCRKFTWTLTSHPTPLPTPRVRSINCCRKFTWTLTSHPTPPPHRMWFQKPGRAYIYTYTCMYVYIYICIYMYLNILYDMRLSKTTKYQYKKVNIFITFTKFYWYQECLCMCIYVCKYLSIDRSIRYQYT